MTAIGTKTLSDVCELIVDSEHKTAPTQDTGYPMIRTPNIGRGRLDLTDVRRVSEDVYHQWTRRAVPQANDIILAREAPVGNAGIVLEGMKVCLGQRTVLIRPDPSQVLPGYLVYLINGDEIQGKFWAASSGATVPHLNLKDIRGLELPELPPIETQRQIADILSAYDDLIENNTRRIQILEEMARTIYREWFVHFRYPGHESVPLVDSPIGPVPEGWEVEELGNLAEENRRTIKPEEFEPDWPYVGLEHIPRRSIALSDWGIANEVNSSKLAFRRGEILFSKIRPYFHKVAVAPVDGICSTDAIVISAKSDEYYPLILACVSSDEFVAHATQTSQGTKMPRANWKVLTKYLVPIPPPDLLTRFNELMTDLVRVIQTLVFRSRNLSATRDLLLPRLVSGGLAV